MGAIISVIRNAVSFIGPIIEGIKIAIELFKKKPVGLPPVPKGTGIRLAALNSISAVVEDTSAPVMTPQQLVEVARKKLNMDIVNHYNFAFIGESGAGKSSLINAIRGVADSNDEDCKDEYCAAKVGETETTMETKRYRIQDIDHLALWDLPGAGTISHPSATYFEDKVLYAFDALVLVIKDRLSEIDSTLLEKAKDANVPVVIISGKGDVAFESILRREDDQGKLSDERKVQLVNEYMNKRKAYIRSDKGFPTSYKDNQLIVEK